MAFNLGDAILYLKANATDLNAKLGRVKKDVNATVGNITASMSSMGTRMAVAGGAITGVFLSAAKASADFGSQMANVATLGVKDLDKLKQGVGDIQKEFGILQAPTKELYDTISAGIPEDAAIMVMKEAAKGAAGGVGSLASALDAGTSIMNAFEKKGRDANETAANMRDIQGQLVTAVKFGKTTIDALGGSVGRSAALMNAAGISSGEYLASIAGLTATGAEASEQVSALKAVLASILKPSQAAADIAASLGLEFNGAGLSAKGLNGFLNEVRAAVEAQQGPLMAQKARLEEQKAALEALAKPTKEQKKLLKEVKDELKGLDGIGGDVNGTLAQLFGGSEALNAVLGLTGSQAEIVAAAMADMGNASANLQKAFKEQQKNDPSFQFRQLVAELKVLHREIGGPVIESLRQLLKYLRPTIDAVVAWVKENPKLLAQLFKVGAVLAVAGPVLIGLAGLLRIVVTTTTAISSLTKWTYAKIAADKLMGAQALKTAAQQGAAATATSGLAASFARLAGRLTFIAGAAGIGWTLGTWINKAIGWFGPYKKAIDLVYDSYYKLYEIIQKVTGLGGYESPAKIGSRTKELIDQGKLNPSKYAAGTKWHRGGLAIVGEKGPELVDLPRGSGVRTAAETRSAMGDTISVNVSVNGGAMEMLTPAFFRRVAEGITREKRLAMGG
jgi:TP901 family phage tail tape measure protein